MKIQLLVKYAKAKKGIFPEEETKEQKKARLEEERTRRIIGLEDEDEVDFQPENKFMAIFDPKNLEFFYQPYVLDTKNIEDFYPYDEGHVMLVTTFSGNLPIKMNWEYWKQMWQTVTGETIIVIEEK